LKGNCKSLLRDAKCQIQEKDALDNYKTEENKRGREDKWSYSTYSINPNQIPTGWMYINTVIEVKKHGQRDNKKYKNTHYYVSNLKLSAKEFAKGIRGHWQIENNLHRTKDVFQNEDKNMIKNMKLASNVSLLQSLSMNLIRLSGISSIKMANEKYANKVKESLVLINSSLYN